MTRKEQIKYASIEYTLKNRPKCIGGDAFAEITDELNRNSAFEEGAKWADMHPVNVWHDASEEPLLEDKEIIFLNEQDIAYISVRFSGTFTFMLEELTWEKFVELLRISKWAYIKDLMPKGGEQ